MCVSLRSVDLGREGGREGKNTRGGGRGKGNGVRGEYQRGGIEGTGNRWRSEHPIWCSMPQKLYLPVEVSGFNWCLSAKVG